MERYHDQKRHNIYGRFKISGLILKLSLKRVLPLFQKIRNETLASINETAIHRLFSNVLKENQCLECFNFYVGTITFYFNSPS